MRLYNDFNLLRLAYEKAEENGIEEGSDTHEEIKSMPLTLINTEVNISALRDNLLWVPIRNPLNPYETATNEDE